MDQFESLWGELKQVFNEYLDVISRDHHKSKDGQLTLRRYYYGWDQRDEGWEVVHDGYVNEFKVQGETPTIAIQRAIAKLKGIIEEENDLFETE